jgi:hypothetical protein
VFRKLEAEEMHGEMWVYCQEEEEEKEDEG